MLPDTLDHLEDQVDTTGHAKSLAASRGSPTSDHSVKETLFQDQWAHSTPAGPGTEFEPNLTPFRRGDDNFIFLVSARNVRRALDSLNITAPKNQTMPVEPNPVTSTIRRHRPTAVHKYIDDSISDSKLNFEKVL